MVAMRRLKPGDGTALAAFYNGLSPSAIRTFRPLGTSTSERACETVCRDNLADVKYDLVAMDDGGRIIGWSFIWNLPRPGTAIEPDEVPTFGLGVADAHRRKGIGGALMDAVLAEACRRALPYVDLTVVKDNAVAYAMYKKRGFVVIGERFEESDGLDYWKMRRVTRPATAEC